MDIARGTISFYAGMIIRNVSHRTLSDVLDEPGLVAVAMRNKKLDRVREEDLARLQVFAKFPKIRFSGYTLYTEKGDKARMANYACIRVPALCNDGVLVPNECRGKEGPRR